ncbi:hypothetical protein UA08_01107 [Talaromyces atroroseus]|uniref:Flavoprotein oxygenase n=1 Tax=Talaromyces atroroseus TaxID=1441469 RepID=A0A225AQX8_TALAT|nr:hypothetical protein UA08_01107 [Talaromyces atroroseus]OKL64012.1 hypothetical protein UA08_01107 [Talaromyces atroroseus]
MDDHPETALRDTEDAASSSRLSSTFATAEIPPDISDAPQHETLTNNADDALEEITELSSSASSRRHSATTEGFLGDGLDNDGRPGPQSTSSRSSLSSIPDSVVVHPKEQQASYGRDSIGTAYGEQEYVNYNNPAVYQKIRDRNSPFRHPSSVKAIQMQTEDEEDEDYKSPSRRRATGFLGSPASVRSLGSPLVRRHGYHSAGATPKKSPVKRENPLVLLHCTILPPTVVLAPGVGLPDRKILEKILPPQYWRRWKLLEEKIIASSLLRDRGLLIQHPQEDYGLLEERVLESLELQRPRLHNGHFLDRETSDSEAETAEDTKALVYKDEGHERSCADCGCHVSRHDDQQKWDVRFYAANGLMKEGAWTAAWKEIERVDVQVSLWLPYGVKNEVERRIQEENLLPAEQQQQQEKAIQAAQPVVDERERRLLSQEQIDGLHDGPKPQTSRLSRRDISGLAYPAPETAENRHAHQDIDLHTLVINSLRVLASDRRKVVTAVSMLIAVLAVVFGGRWSRRAHYGSEVVQFGHFPAVSTQVYYTSSASCVLTQTSTETPLSEIANGMERPSEIQRVAQGVKEEKEEEVPADYIAYDESVQSASQQPVEPTIETAEPKVTENPSSEAQIEISESISVDQTIPEPIEAQPVETVDHQALSPPSTSSESDMVVDHITLDENELDTNPSAEINSATTAENDDVEAT